MVLFMIRYETVYKRIFHRVHKKTAEFQITLAVGEDQCSALFLKQIYNSNSWPFSLQCLLKCFILFYKPRKNGVMVHRFLEICKALKCVLYSIDLLYYYPPSQLT